MKSTLPATHFFRQFLLFTLTVVFLMTVVRAAYGLWQFPKLADTEAFIPFFLQGLRFDLALTGLICIIPLVLGSLLAMTGATRVLAKFLVTTFLCLGLLVILMLELVTPWFVDTQGLRPDIHLLGGVENPVESVKGVANDHLIPLIVGSVLCVLVLIAFWARLEVPRFLRYRISVPGALVMSIIGGALCVLAIWSNIDPNKTALSPGDALISTDSTVNDLAMNSTYKTLYSLLQPLIEKIPDGS